MPHFVSLEYKLLYDLKHIIVSKHLKHVKQICLQNLNKHCLKLDVRPILDAYNLLGYGEPFLRHPENFKKQTKNIKNKYKKICVFIFSWFFRKCFPVSQEVVGIKNRPEIEF